MQPGDTLTWERVFTRADVEAFTAVVRDAGRHHVEPDAQGRLVVHGLFTASLATRIGGALDYLAREMRFTFKKPVWSGERVKCVVTITGLEVSRAGTRLSADIECFNEAGEVVLEGATAGTIPKPLEEVLTAPLPELKDQ
jgi:acyl dehydratase